MAQQQPSPFIHQPPFVPDPHGVLVPGVFVDGNAYGQCGKQVDNLATARIVRAALDRCTPCQDHYLDVLAADVLTLAYFVDYACSEVGYALTKAGQWDGTGQLPPSMTDPAADGIASADFRLAARQWRRQQPDVKPALYDALADYDVAARRRVAIDALEMLVGIAVVTGADA